MKIKISLIAALSQNRAIGKGNQLIWKIPDDLKHFREITSGHPVIMGRKTFESIGKILPNRLNIVISRNPNFSLPRPGLGSYEGSVVVQSLEEALRLAQGKQNKPKDEIFIIGGGQIFEQAIKIADKLYLTIIEKEFEGDTFFPDYSSFKKVSESPVYEYQGIKYRFEEWEK